MFPPLLHLLQPFLLQNVGDNDVNLKRTVDEIKKLQEEVSALRQENIQLKVRKRERERGGEKRPASDKQEGIQLGRK